MTKDRIERRPASATRLEDADLMKIEPPLVGARQRLADLERRLASTERALTARNEALAIKDLELARTARALTHKNRQLADTERHVAAIDRDRAILVRWMRRLDHGLAGLLVSKRWRAGNLLVNLCRTALFRPRAPTAVEPLKDVMRAFRTWERERARHTPNADACHDEMTPAHPSTGGHTLASPRARRRHDLTVAVLAWDVSHNALGRAYMLAEALARRFEVRLMGPLFEQYGRHLWGPLRDGAIPITTFPGAAYPAFGRQLAAIAGQLDADVILACKPRMPSLQLGLLAKHCRNRPLLVDIDDYELSFYDDGTPLSLSQLAARPDDPELRAPYGEPWTRFAETLLPYCDHVLVSNEALRAKFGGTVVPHARDEAHFEPDRYDRAQIRREIGVGPDDKVIFFGGTVRWHKGVVQLATAVRALKNPHYKLCILGVISNPRLEDRVREASGHHLIFLGERPFRDLPRYLSAADLVCSLQNPAKVVSSYQLPAKIVDALAMGVPVLAYQTLPLEPLIRAGAVTPVTRESLSDALAHALTHSDTLRAQQRARRRLFEDQYSYDAIGRRLEEIILGALRQPRQLPPDALDFQRVQQALPDAAEELPLARHEPPSEDDTTTHDVLEAAQ